MPHDDDLMHYGVKGMHWGNRKGDSSESSANSAARRQKAIRIGGAVALTAGAAATAVILARSGHLNASALSSGKKAASVAAGRATAAAHAADHAAWKKNVSNVLKDIAEANAEQDRYMRGLGLGAAINRKA